MLTVLYQNVHTRADSSWQQLQFQVDGQLQLRYYLGRQPGLLSVRSSRALKLQMPDGSYQRIRMTYVPKTGDVVALTPKGW